MTEEKAFRSKPKPANSVNTQATLSGCCFLIQVVVGKNFILSWAACTGPRNNVMWQAMLWST